jgi:hypothetical protein
MCILYGGVSAGGGGGERQNGCHGPGGAGGGGAKAAGMLPSSRAYKYVVLAVRFRGILYQSTALLKINGTGLY